MKDRDLTLVGLTDDKQRLVLVSDAGDEFTLPADARLRAALRGEHARLGQLEITMESALRPRDIQSRIRSGESPESVAAAAQTPLEKVMAYATPVLAERAHIAGRAQAAAVRRRSGEGPTRVLSDAVIERLRGRNVDPSTVEWDAWRRDDGRWTVVADYRSGENPRHAEFVFDVPGRYVLAEDDEARWLVGEPTALTGPQPRAVPGPRRLTTVSSDVDELPLGEDAIEMVTESDPAPVTEIVPEIVPDEYGDTDWIATQASARLRTAEASTLETVELGSEADDPDDATHDATHDATDDATDDATPEAAIDEEPARPARKSKRASVPSWDEIMFGGGKQD